MPPPPLPMRAAMGTQTQPAPQWDLFPQHPGTGLTPQSVIGLYRMAELGWPQQQCDLFEDVVENDGHLRSVMEARTLAVAGKKWQVMAGGEAAIDQRAAEILEDALRQSNFADMIAHVLSSRYMGYAGSEIDWADIDGDIVPRWFVNVPCRRFRFDELDAPRLLTTTDYTGAALRPGHWVFARNATTGVTARSGLLRTATWYALFKRWSWRDWVIYAEKFGIPLVIGKYGQGATEEDKTALTDAVTDIGEAGQAVMSQETEIDIRESQRTSGSDNLHSGIVREANNEISKLITGSTLTVETGGPGSFALGKVHETRAFDLVLADAELVMRRVAADVIRPFMVFNGFADAAPPDLIIHVTRESDPLTRAQLAKILSVDMGLPLDSEQLREEFQFRAPPSEARTLEPPDPDPAFPQPAESD